MTADVVIRLPAGAIKFNVEDHVVPASDVLAKLTSHRNWHAPAGMPGMPTNLWGASPLYENETLFERHYTKCKSKRSKY